VAPEIKAILAAMAAFLLVELGKDWLSKRELRKQAESARERAKAAGHEAARAKTEAELEVRRERRRGKTMGQRGRDLLGLARDLLRRDGSGSNKGKP
jgi:hypothetical protein